MTEYIINTLVFLFFIDFIRFLRYTRLHITSRRRHTHESDWVELIMTSDQKVTWGKPVFEQKNHYHFLLMSTGLQLACIKSQMKLKTNELLC